MMLREYSFQGSYGNPGWECANTLFNPYFQFDLSIQPGRLPDEVSKEFDSEAEHDILYFMPI